MSLWQWQFRQSNADSKTYPSIITKFSQGSPHNSIDDNDKFDNIDNSNYDNDNDIYDHDT